MAYEQTGSKLPQKLSWLGVQTPISKTDEREIIAELDADQLAVVALCPAESFVDLSTKPKEWLPIFHNTVFALEDNPKLTQEQKAIASLPWTAADSSHQRISAILHADGRLVPLKIVKSKYVPMQNIEVAIDARFLEDLSGGKTTLVSGSVSRNRAIVAINMRFEDALIEVDGSKKILKQAATLFTSHDSTLAYSIAFSVSPADRELIIHWNIKKQRNTEGMTAFREKLMENLLELEGEAKSFMNDLELLGQRPLPLGSTELRQAIDLVVSAIRPPKPEPWFDDWVTKKLTTAFEVMSTIYGFNALSFYMVANEWVLTKKRNKKHFIAVADVSANDFKVQSQLKQFLFSMYTGK